MVFEDGSGVEVVSFEVGNGMVLELICFRGNGVVVYCVVKGVYIFFFVKEENI